jgi:hypothetical protein
VELLQRSWIEASNSTAPKGALTDAIPSVDQGIRSDPTTKPLPSCPLCSGDLCPRQSNSKSGQQWAFNCIMYWDICVASGGCQKCFHFCLTPLRISGMLMERTPLSLSHLFDLEMFEGAHRPSKGAESLLIGFRRFGQARSVDTSASCRVAFLAGLARTNNIALISKHGGKIVTYDDSLPCQGAVPPAHKDCAPRPYFLFCGPPRHGNAQCLHKGQGRLRDIRYFRCGTHRIPPTSGFPSPSMSSLFYGFYFGAYRVSHDPAPGRVLCSAFYVLCSVFPSSRTTWCLPCRYHKVN